ncbi:MAG TPA: DUF3175 domain-containing protein [Gemmatimonadaceae bacterium]|nr:DUF3175 domain-containing protein [Gemmatimonadaceae bacterium]
MDWLDPPLDAAHRGVVGPRASRRVATRSTSTAAFSRGRIHTGLRCRSSGRRERSYRRKSEPYRSAMSMLTFYIDRAGDNLGSRQRRALERAKDELHEAFAKNAKPNVRSKKGARR